MNMNMSHCRFENTFLVLKECENALSEDIYPLEGLSECEKKYALKLLDLCKNMVDNYYPEEEPCPECGVLTQIGHFIRDDDDGFWTCAKFYDENGMRKCSA